MKLNVNTNIIIKDAKNSESNTKIVSENLRKLESNVKDDLINVFAVTKITKKKMMKTYRSYLLIHTNFITIILIKQTFDLVIYFKLSFQFFLREHFQNCIFFFL